MKLNKRACLRTCKYAGCACLELGLQSRSKRRGVKQPTLLFWKMLAGRRPARLQLTSSKPKPLSDDVERLRSRKAKRDDSPITKNDHIDDIPDSKKSQVCALGIVGSSFPNTHMRSRTLNGPGETSRKIAMRMRLSTWLQILLHVRRRTRKMVQGLAFCSIQNTSSWAARWSWTAYVDVALLKKFPVAWKVYACRRA